MRPMLRGLLICLALGLLAQAGGAASARSVPPGAVQVRPASTFDGFTDQFGRPMTAQRLAGKVVVQNFIFAQCGSTCPVQTAQLVELQKSLPAELRDKVYFVSVTIDPLHDTPEVLHDYAHAHGVDEARWSFLDSKPEAFARLASEFSALRPGKSLGFNGMHSTDIRLIDPQGRVRQRYAGAPVDVERLRRDIAVLAHLNS